jgi:hypothetical protein
MNQSCLRHETKAMKTQIFILFAAGAFGLLGQSAARAQFVFVTNPTATGIAGAGGLNQQTYGVMFGVGATDVSVTSLGYFDVYGDGLNKSHDVGIFDLSANLLGHAVVSSGTAATLHDGIRWADLATPIPLSANTSYMLAYTLGTAGDDFVYWGAPGDWWITVDSHFTVQGNGWVFANGSGLLYPTLPGGNGDWYFGGNLEATPVPEPRPILGAFLLLCGVAGRHLLRRRGSQANPRRMAASVA